MERYYDIFGLPVTATEEQIKERYEQLLKSCEKLPKKEYYRVCRIIQEAYFSIVVNLPKTNKSAEAAFVLERNRELNKLTRPLNMRGLKRIGAGVLAGMMLFVLTGCSKDDRDILDQNEKEQAQVIKNRTRSLMEQYKSRSFIKDYGLYNDAYPEFYVGEVGRISCFGVLTNKFDHLTGGSGSTNRYFVNLIEMYDGLAYKETENGDLIFDWSQTDRDDFDTTTFSSRNNENEKEFVFEDKKDGKILFTRTICDSGKEVSDKIVFQRDLSDDVHVTVESTSYDRNYYEDFGYDEILFNSGNPTRIKIDYYGEIYEFTKVYRSHGDVTSNILYLPDGEIDNDSLYMDDYFALEEAICSKENYESDQNRKAIACFEKYLSKKKCMELFLQGSEGNNNYDTVKSLINSGEYESALMIMESDAHWKVVMRLYIQ